MKMSKKAETIQAVREITIRHGICLKSTLKTTLIEVESISMTQTCVIILSLIFQHRSEEV